MKLYNNFSMWVFGLIIAWWAGIEPFSPLLAILINLALVSFYVTRQYDFNFSWVALLLVLLHAKPTVLFYKHGFDILPTLAFFGAYNAFLMAQGTTLAREYKGKYNDTPDTVMEFIRQA
jgi:hypothetical protein